MTADVPRCYTQAHGLQRREDMKTAAQILGLGGHGTTGWVDARGRWIPCEYGQHLEAARVAGVADPDSAGWIHVSRGHALRPSRDLTQRQIDRLAEVLGGDLPAWALEVA